MTFLAGFSTHS